MKYQLIHSNCLHLTAHNGNPLCVAAAYDRGCRTDTGGFEMEQRSRSEVQANHFSDIVGLCGRCLRYAPGRKYTLQEDGRFFVNDPELNNRTEADREQMASVDRRLNDAARVSRDALEACWEIEKVDLTGYKFKAAETWLNKYREKLPRRP